jgi:AcrR family transcriptional regulator
VAISAEGTGGKRRGRSGKADVLLAAGHRLVLAHGENFTTQDLIREADVGLQTLYRNFGGKDQLLVAVMADLIRAQCSDLERRASTMSAPVERLRFYVQETLRLLRDFPEARVSAGFLASQRWRLYQLLPAQVTDAMRPFAKLIERELEQANLDGTLRSASPEDDAALISRLVMATFHHQLYSGEETGDEAERVWRFCLAAVGGSEK